MTGNLLQRIKNSPKVRLATVAAGIPHEQLASISTNYGKRGDDVSFRRQYRILFDIIKDLTESDYTSTVDTFEAAHRAYMITCRAWQGRRGDVTGSVEDDKTLADTYKDLINALTRDTLQRMKQLTYEVPPKENFRLHEEAVRQTARMYEPHLKATEKALDLMRNF